MNYLYDLLFRIAFDGDYVYLLYKVLTFIGIWLALLYAIYLILTKVIKSNLHKDFQLKLNFLWALGIFQVLVSIYFFYLLRVEGVSVFKWNDFNFYLGIFPQLFIYVGTIILFLVSRKNYLQHLRNL